MSVFTLAPNNGDQKLVKGWLTVEGFESHVSQLEGGLGAAQDLEAKDALISEMIYEQFPASSTETALGENHLSPAPRLSLRDFTITRPVGNGTYGTVHLVKHNATGRCGALKITNKYLEGNRKRRLVTRSEQLQTATRFFITLQEQRALRRVSGAPGMQDMLASFHDSSNFYVFSEYYSGGDLERRLTGLGRFSVHDTRFYAAELILGLQTLRNMGVIHRDIKPANVLIDADGHLALADFGLARTFDEYDGLADWGSDPLPPSPSDDPLLLKRRTDMRCGSAEYMAPEIIVGEDYSHPADMWSVGVITFQMLVGRLPWDRDDYDDKNDFDTAVLQLPAFATEEEVTEFGLDGATINLIDCMLEKHQENRPIPSDMQEHPFFETMDWKKLSQRQIPAPWIPCAEDEEVASGQPTIIIEGTPVESAEDPFPAFTFMSPKMELLALLSKALTGLDTPERPSSICSTLCNPDSSLTLTDKEILPPTDTKDVDMDCCSEFAFEPTSEPGIVASEVSDVSRKVELLALLSKALDGFDTPGRPSSIASTLCDPDSSLYLADDKILLPMDVSDSADVVCYGYACESISEPVMLASQVTDLRTPDLDLIPCPPSVSSVISDPPVIVSQTSQVHVLDIPYSSSVRSTVSDDIIDPTGFPCPLSVPSVVSEHLAPRHPIDEPSLTFASPDQDLELGLVGDCDFEQPAKLSIFGRLKSWAVGMFNWVKNAWSLWGSAASTF